MLKPSRLFFAFFLFTIAAMAGCASSPATQHVPHKNKSVVSKPVYKGDATARLQKHFSRWQGTPYQYGGLSRRGVDCSGFIYLTYRDVFGRKIPRTTKLQAGIGKTISRKNLRIGDLVFFKTGRNQRHTGVYIGDGKFIHASSSKGVTTSRLKTPYWQQRYWKSIRVD